MSNCIIKTAAEVYQNRWLLEEQRAERAEAELNAAQDELAALKVRRCHTCHHSRHHGKLCTLFDIYFPAEFACNRWTAQTVGT